MEREFPAFLCSKAGEETGSRSVRSIGRRRSQNGRCSPLTLNGSYLLDPLLFAFRTLCFDLISSPMRLNSG
ncbi:hypothetical protein TNCV_3336431 [Trichonephila clavipes]|nr:hypothetical protein TNCV_3336431 [Trichonephila clavipes]